MSQQTLQFGNRGQSIMSTNEEYGRQQHQNSSTFKRPSSSHRSISNGTNQSFTQTPPKHSIGSFTSTPSSIMTPNLSTIMTSPSLSSNAEGFFGRESRADSIGTLWSSADVPLMFDGNHRGSNGDRSSIVGGIGSSNSISMQTSPFGLGNRSNSSMNFPRGISFTTTQSSSQQTLHAAFTNRNDSDLSGLLATTNNNSSSSPKSDNNLSKMINHSQIVKSSSEQSELLLSDDGQEFIAVHATPRSTRSNNNSRPSTGNKSFSESSISKSSSRLPTGWTISDEDAIESNVATLQRPGSRPGSSAGPKRRPAPLQLSEASFGVGNTVNPSKQSTPSSGLPTPLASFDRTKIANDVPVSVSHGSQMTLKSMRSKSKLKSNEQNNSTLQNRKKVNDSLDSNQPIQKAKNVDLYRHAERFFDSSYSMAQTTTSTLALSTPDMARLSRFSDDSHVTFDDAGSSIGPLDGQINGSSNGRGGLSSGRSQASHSSAESSNTPEIVEQIANAATAHLLKSGLTSEARNATLTNNGSYSKLGLMDEEQPMTPLRVAMSLASPSSPRLIEHHTIMDSSMHPMGQTNGRRPSTTDAAIPSQPKIVTRPNVRHAHTSSDQELLRRLQAEVTGKIPEGEGISSIPIPKKVTDDKLAFLHTPSELPVPPSPKRGALFGLRIRAVSTPKLRQSRCGSQDGNNTTVTNEKEFRPMSSSRAQHPPQAPSGRYRNNATTKERCDSVGSTGSNGGVGQQFHRISTAGSDESSLHANQTQQTKSRRPSSTEALAAAARRLRRPSRNGSNTSLTAPLTTFGGGSSSTVDLNRQRVGSSASSQLHGDLHHVNSNASLRPNSRKASAKASSTSLGNTASSRPKTKSGWASHLTQGLTLHIEQGNKKFACRMNYQYYDPFGKPESLCTAHTHAIMDEQNNRSRSSFSTPTNEDHNQDEQAMGILEFTPDSSPSSNGSGEIAQPSPTRMAFLISDSKDAVTLKHLTIGDDTKADLITKQADLSLRNAGIHEVSGSERKGKVSWRFEFAVEEFRRSDGEGGMDQNYSMNTPKMDGRTTTFNEVIEGVKILRPIRFACSTTLLDPSRARKSRVFNMIRKQIGSHIESHSLAGSEDVIEVGTPPHTAQSFPSGSSQQTSPIIQHIRRAEAPLSPRSQPRSRQGSSHNLRRGEIPPPFDPLQQSPNRTAFQTIIPSSPCQTRSPLYAPSSLGSSIGAGGAGGLMSDESNFNALRNASVVSAASSSAGSALWSPASRPGLVPFKGRRAIVDPSRQVYGRTSTSEQGGQGGINAFSSTIQASPLTIGSSLETSLTSIEGSPSPKKNLRELSSSSQSNTPQPTNKKYAQQQTYSTTTKRAIPSTALGLETNSTSSQRRLENRDEYIYDDSCRQWASSQSRTRNRRIRAVTAEGTAGQNSDMVEQDSTFNTNLIRPITASEEIKMAYLNSTALSSATNSRTNTPLSSSTKPRSRHGGNGSGHGHSHSVIQAPSASAAAAALSGSGMEFNPPRRLTSASIHQHQQMNEQSSSSNSTSPYHNPKNLPPTPPGKMKRMPMVATSAAVRIISGNNSSRSNQTNTSKSFEPPEGPFWM